MTLMRHAHDGVHRNTSQPVDRCDNEKCQMYLLRAVVLQDPEKYDMGHVIDIVQCFSALQDLATYVCSVYIS